MPPYREPFPEKARPQSFKKPAKSILGPNGQYNAIFEFGWEGKSFIVLLVRTFYSFLGPS